MTEDQAKQWVKNKINQQKVIAAVITDDVPTSKSAIFMAGIPGAGKTEFVTSFTRQPDRDFVIIEHDKLVEYIDGYLPENYYNFRTAGSTLVSEVFKESLKQGKSFIFDGTLAHDNGIRNIKKTLKAGFNVTVIYIHQDAKRAWELTLDREVVKKRSINKDGFVKTTNSLNMALMNIFSAFKENEMFSFWIFKKNGQAGMENAEFIPFDHSENIGTSGDIESILSEAYNTHDI